MTAVGLQGVAEIASEYGALSFVIRQHLLKMQTCMPVRVVKVSQAGDVAAAGYVDVLPLVQMVSGDGTAIAQGVIHRVPYMRTQGGTNAVICDPVVGDIGVAVFASRDISAVKVDPENSAGVPPPSLRAYDFADALYLGVILTGTPTQFVRFVDGKIILKAPTIEVEGDLTVTGTVVAQGDVEGAGVSLATHTHGGVTTGGGTTGPPVP